jgi:hypothetical protein
VKWGGRAMRRRPSSRRWWVTDGSRFVTSRPVFWLEKSTEKVCKSQKTGKTRTTAARIWI